MRAFGLWFVIFLITSLGVLAVPLDSDTAVEMNSVRRWFEQGASLGIDSSLPGVTHGSSVLRIYELCRLLHVPLAWVQFLFAAAFAAGVAIIAHSLRSLSSRSLAWAEVAVVFLFAATSFNVVRLWNMSLTPLFAAMFAVTLLEWVRSGAVCAFLGMAFALGLATECQIGSLTALPAVAVLLAAAPVRPRLIVWFLAFGAAAVVPAALSFSIWLQNIRVLAERYALLSAAALATVGLAMMLGRMIRPAWARLSDAQRVRSAIAVVIASVWTLKFLGELVFGLSLGGGRIESILWGLHALVLVFGLRFLLRSASPAATAFAHAAILLLTLAVWLGVRVLPQLPMLYPRLGQSSPWSFADMQTLADELRERDVAWDAADAHLWTTEPSLVLGYLKADLRPEAQSNIGAMDDLLVLKTAARILEKPLPPGWTSFPLSTFTVALVHPFRSQLDVRSMEVELEGKEVTLRRAAMSRGESAEPAQARYAQSGATPAVWDESGKTFRVHLRIPRRVEPKGSAHSFVVIPPDNEMDWWFAGPESAPASRRRCQAPGDGDDAIHLEGESRYSVFLPAIVEFSHGDDELIQRVFAEIIEASPCFMAPAYR